MESLPQNLADLRASGWQSKSVKQEIHDNLLAALSSDETLFTGMLGYEETVIPEIINAIIAQHDILFLGEKGQGKSRLMRQLVSFLDENIPYLDIPGSPVHEDPYHPITKKGKELIRTCPEEEIKISYWHRSERYAERLAPGTKFADIIGEIDPAKLASGTSMSTEDALHFGLIPRMHRAIFAMNELPDLDELVQVGLFNILEERDVQIRGFPVSFDLDVMILFSANPSTYNRSGKVIPQLKDRIGSSIVTHYPVTREIGIQIMEQESEIDLGGDFPVIVPYFMREVIEQISVEARKCKFIDQQSGVSARLSIANYRTMVSSARQRGARLKENPTAPRVSDLAHLSASSLGKLELDMMGSNQMSESQVIEWIIAQAIETVFGEYVSKHDLQDVVGLFEKGVRIEVGDMLPSSEYADRLRHLPPAWEKAFEINASSEPAVRASCVEFILAGLYVTDRISRSQKHGTISYQF